MKCVRVRAGNELDFFGGACIHACMTDIESSAR